jgi:hypothetical protein
MTRPKARWFERDRFTLDEEGASYTLNGGSYSINGGFWKYTRHSASGSDADTDSHANTTVRSHYQIQFNEKNRAGFVLGIEASAA